MNALKKDEEKKKKSNVNSILFFVAFMAWLFSSIVISQNQVDAVYGNREAMECLIQQMSEHRLNNRSAHEAEAAFHDYEYPIAETNVPSNRIFIDANVCNKWIGDPRMDEEDTKSSGITDWLFGN